MTYVRKLRLLKNGLSQDGLAEQARISKSAIHRFETGKTASVTTVQAVAQALGVPVGQIAEVAPGEKYLVAVAAE